ncbi:MAG: glutathione S-transferase family protein [Candidatus Binatia bacterium]
MKLYEFGPTRSLRARWTLQEMDVDFQPITVNLLKGEHKAPAFLKVNPAGKIPVLVDGNRVINESVAIVLYLADKFPDRKLIPTDLAERGEFYRWLLFTTTELEQPLWRIARNTRLYPVSEQQPSDIAIASREFREMAAVLEHHMEGREFVAGTRVSVADFVTAYTLDWGHEAGLLGGFPNLNAYLERMYARPKAVTRIAAAFAAIEGFTPAATGT